MRRPDGSINREIKSQKSKHIVAGSVYDFMVARVPTRMTAELYYKEFSSLVPYKFDNVRVVYSGENEATGTAMGIDFRLNGEFVKDAESWISLSLMKINHDITGDGLPAYPAPSDSRFSTTIYFQDYLPTDPSLRAHINIQFSTGIPVSSPYSERYDSYYRMPSYRRVDIGFSKVFDRETGRNIGMPRWIQSIIAGIEVFNLLILTIQSHITGLQRLITWTER
ncbi:MAG: hypothetical protein R2727_10600 [Bacteroidales bacterium]